MKKTIILLASIFVALILLIFIVFLFDTLNTHLQLSGYFGDIHRPEADNTEHDGFYWWGSKHYLFFWSQFLIVVFYILSCLILGLEYLDKVNFRKFK